MTDLVRIEKLGFGNEEVNSVNARDVWEFLESKREFANWIKDRLEGFQESVDFEGFDKIVKNEFGINVGKRIDYFLTLDTAKHICMIERNAKGKQLRQYFIDCEKRLLSNPPSTPSLPTDYISALKALIESEESKQKLIEERDHAIKTKSQISDSKTATAMATASVANRKAKAAEEKLEKNIRITTKVLNNCIDKHPLVAKNLIKTLLENVINPSDDDDEPNPPCHRGCKD